MKKRTIATIMTIAAVSVVTVAVAAGGGTAATESEQQAIDAALAAVPGEFLEVEPEDDGREGFEVEIRTADGTELEVHVDLEGNVVGMDQDTDGTSDDSSEDSDVEAPTG